MKQPSFPIVFACWITFFLKLSEGISFPWDWISYFIGLGAVIVTAMLHGAPKPQAELKPRSRLEWILHEPTTRGGFLLYTLCWAIGLTILTRPLPTCWSQMFPLMVIVALYCASRIWPAGEPEDRPDVPAPQGVDREA
jgi:hypothetical protein